ncbi:MAG TPA: YbaB/EbfC family nucleoid-associated protein [Chloroflexota bacterium]|nr:YbaB/EbfC family nucleoid-associated protein [Chloroflexota bacterium]
MRPNVNQIKKLQQQMAKIQAELGNETVEATVGGGVVTITMNGHQQVVGVKIAPDVIDPNDPQMLEDLLTAAFNEATEKVQELISKRMGAVTGGLGLPGFM